MDFDNRVEPQLSFMGYMPGANDTWRIRYNDITYGVDFVQQQIFKMVGDERRFEDPEDKFLNNTIKVVNNAMEKTTEDVPEAGNGELHDNENEESSSMESPQDADRQESKHEELTESKDVVIPNKNIVPFTPGIKGIVPQLCECGKIKIGKKGETRQGQHGTYRLPTKLDHFIVTTTAKTEEDDFEEDTEIMEILGEGCTAIPVMLLYDNPDLNFMTSLAYYDSAKCQCRGNGEVAIKADGTQIECNPENCSFATQKKCKPNGVLSVILLDAPRVGGVWKFRTTGWNSIRNLGSSIKFIHDLTGGRLAGLPLMLTLQPKTTVIPGTKNTTKIYMVNIEYRGTMVELLSRADTRYVSTEKIAQIEADASEMLAIPESPEECQDVQEEFYPETIMGGDA